MNKLVYIIGLLLFSSSLVAQNSTKKDRPIIRYQLSVDTAIKLYKNFISKDCGHINGREYKPYHYPNGSNPFFKSSQGTGTIYTDGVKYENQIIYYDINLDELILVPSKHGMSRNYIKINKSRIDSFDIRFNKDTYRLTNIKSLNPKFTNIPSGFYEIVYCDEYSYIINHSTSLKKDGGYPIYNYIKIKYLKKNGHCTNITRKSGFLKFFAQYKKAIRKKIRGMQVRYKDLSKSQMIMLIKYIESF